MDETARKMLPNNKEYELRKESIRKKCRKLPPEELFSCNGI